MDLLLVEDHVLVREGIRMLAESTGIFDHTIECSSLTTALHEATRDAARIGLVMLDLELPDATGLLAVERIRESLPNTPILVVSAESDAAIVDGALERGARGYLPKSASGARLRMAVQAVLEGRQYVPPHILPASGAMPRVGARGPQTATGAVRLTPRQTEVLLLLAKGCPNKEIAHALSLSLSTVRVHVSAILDRLGVENRTQAAMSATAQQLLADRAAARDPDGRCAELGSERPECTLSSRVGSE